MRRTFLPIAALILFVAPLLATSGTHFALVRSAPAKDQKTDVAPTRLQLWFSQTPAPAVSQISLKRDAAEVALGKTTVVDKDHSIYADPIKPLTVGAYTLSWRAAGDDGHVMSGELKFSIVAKSTP